MPERTGERDGARTMKLLRELLHAVRVVIVILQLRVAEGAPARAPAGAARLRLRESIDTFQRLLGSHVSPRVVSERHLPAFIDRRALPTHLLALRQ